ncbi:retrotransposon protein, putative, ty1-copia subclass [Tanacetum coccineum]|uniref:Retrotransposon protein, putative, ty1-copia subclass n=1 Tax=Tanacetum coccineum TaxID=301880 RepID=A0ABQ4X851_9ASTR
MDNYVLMRDRAKRTTTIPARYRDECNVSLSRPSRSKVDDMAAYAFTIAEEEYTHEPITFQEAINSSEKDEWVRAMKEEMSSLKKNLLGELVDSTLWVILSLTACEDYELEQLDVKTAFLHGNLEETIYMRQPPGFEEGTGNKVCLLKKSLYGLKQSPRQWYKRFDVYMTSNGFSRSNYDSCVYFKEFAPGIWRIQLKPTGVNLRSVIVNCDNQSAIHLSRNAMFHERMKHINVRYHFIREIVESKEIEVAKIGTKDNAADAFTKVVPGPSFQRIGAMKYLVVGIN